MPKVDLSIVVTAHDEGVLLYKTLRSVFESAEELKRDKIKYEVIVHVDNGSRDTLDCLKRYAKKEDIRVVENSFGDISRSRNFAVSVAGGKYVSFLDGDDLVSKNWYSEAMGVLRRNGGNCIVYPEVVLTFQNNNNHIITTQRDYNSTKEDYLTILSANQWGSVVLAKKAIFLKVPYITMGKGYCHEDYAFNVQTLEMGIPHLVAKGTVLFYRRLEGSRLSMANNDNLVLPEMSYFGLEKIKSEFENDIFFCEDEDDEGDDGGVEEDQEKSFRDNVIYKKVRGNWFLNYLITPFLRLTLEVKKKIKHEELEEEGVEDAGDEERVEYCVPEIVIEKWREINDIDIQLYPKKEDLEGTVSYDARDSIDIGKAFFNMSHAYTHIPDYIFIVPWVVRGGADKVMINYINALLKVHPTWHIAVITTLPEENTWACQLPKRVDLYNVGEMTRYLSEGGVDALLTLLITQLKCKRIHIINSEWGYRWARNHNTLVREQYEVNVSFFAEELITEWDGGKRIASYENPCLFNIFQNVKNVFTDNENIINITVDRNDFDRKKFKVHYQPIDLPIKKRTTTKKKFKKILWAGRIDTVKMPELVLEIGKQLEDGVQIDMYGVITNDCYNGQMFENAKNINYCGKYNGFQEIPVDNYDLFLYTSKNDGMPNVILEATAAGLPIIASNDGGVGEFIRNKKTGLLVQDFRNAKEYVEVIGNVYKDKYDLDEYVQNAQKLLKERHSMSKFIDLVKKDIG